MTTQPTPTFQPLDTKDLLVVLQEMGAALRARSDPEHIYTAAAVGYFGAVAWGVAALKSKDCQSLPIWKQPATVAAAGVFFVAFCVVWKIIREHKQFAKIKGQYNQVADRLKAFPNGDVMKNWPEPAGKGVWFSVVIVIVAALAAFIFCLCLVG